MEFKLAHNNINVLNLDKSLRFYKEALGLVEMKRYEKENGEFIKNGLYLFIVSLV